MRPARRDLVPRVGDYLRALAALGGGRTEEVAVHARTALDGKHRLHDRIGIAMTIDL